MQEPATQHNDLDAEPQQAQVRRNEAVLALLEAWDKGDPDEQRETWAILKQALDEHPISFRSKLP